MKTPENVNYIIQRLENAGFSTYIVGGCVRDMLMDIEPKDWDIASSAKPDEIKALFEKTYDTGIKHGTVTVVINALKYEITTFRMDGEYKDARHPESVTFSTNIKDDLSRRDFTINAIAYNQKVGFIDPFEGIRDINDKIIRGVGCPSDRIKEDALRMLRAVRFSAALDFTIEEETSVAIINNAVMIGKISAERVRDELLELLLSTNSGMIFSCEFMAIIGNISEPLMLSIKRNKEYLEKLLFACKKDKTLRLVVLIGFLNDNEADAFLKQLKLSNAMYRYALKLHKIRNVTIYKDYYSVVKTVSEWGFDIFEDYLYLQMLDCIVHDLELEYVMAVEDYFRLILENNLPVFIKDLSINGFDLSNEFNITGPIVGKILAGLLDYVHANPYKNSFESLLKQAYLLLTNKAI